MIESSLVAKNISSCFKSRKYYICELLRTFKKMHLVFFFFYVFIAKVKTVFPALFNLSAAEMHNCM